jgi:hypothetical protein
MPEVETVQVPDFYLRRPAGSPGADHAAFDRLFTQQVATATGRRIDYQLAAPKWQFLCWITEQRDFLLHGSNREDIDEFTPRQADDIGEFGARVAVYAASDGIWPMFFAVANRTVVRSLVNACVRTADGTETFYYFSVNDDAVARQRWVTGTVYVLPRRTFEPEPEDAWQGRALAPTQWASPVPVKPLARLQVTPADFPFLAQVHSHDQRAVTRRAAADPDAFPWRE